MSRLKERLMPALLLGSALAIVPVAAWAHGEVESGRYVFEIGWIVEPVVVGERNGIDLFVAHHDDPGVGIPDLTTLQFTVEYGGAGRSRPRSPSRSTRLRHPFQRAIPEATVPAPG